MLAKVISLVALVAAAAVSARPQAICGLHGRYLNSADQHTPCDLAAILVGGGVKPADSPFPDLAEQGLERYPAPTAEEVNELRCNPVFYNLVSACGACQGSRFSWVSWAEWSENCESITGISYIAQNIPGNIPLPSWVFIPPSASNGTFDRLSALTETEAKTPDSFFPKLVLTQTNSCTEKTPAGAIAGSVVGGVVGLALVGVLAMFLFRRKATQHPPVQSRVTMSDTESIDTIMRQKAAA